MQGASKFKMKPRPPQKNWRREYWKAFEAKEREEKERARQEQEREDQQLQQLRRSDGQCEREHSATASGSACAGAVSSACSGVNSSAIATAITTADLDRSRERERDRQRQLKVVAVASIAALAAMMLVWFWLHSAAMFGGDAFSAVGSTIKRPAVCILSSAGAAAMALRCGAQVSFTSGPARSVSATAATSSASAWPTVAQYVAPATPASSSSLTFGAAAVGVAVVAANSRRCGRCSRHSSVVEVTQRAGVLADCPYTLYGEKDIDVSKERVAVADAECPLEVHMPQDLKGDLNAQRAYFEKNMSRIYKDLKTHGAMVFRGFELSREAEGFQKVGEALELERCEDPLHSVTARDAVNKDAGVYEAVNKPSRRKFCVGMRNEMVGNRACGAAIFVCFKAAEEGGEFLVADGRKMFKMLDEDWLETSYDKEIRYSTAEFPIGFVESLGPLQSLAEPVVYGVMQQALRMKVDFETELRWERSEYYQSKILQVRAMPQPPNVRQPYTGKPAWWGSMHSHSEYLRKEREKLFGEEGIQEPTGASRINKAKVYYADTGAKVADERMTHVDEVTKQAAVKYKMEKGDMLLLDRNLVRHGRCPSKAHGNMPSLGTKARTTRKPKRRQATAGRVL